MDDVRKHIVDEKKFSEGEMMAAIEKMSDDNKIMLSADVLYLIWIQIWWSEWTRVDSYDWFKSLLDKY